MARRSAAINYNRNHTALHAGLERLIVSFEPRKGVEPLRLPSSPKNLDHLVDAFYEDADPVELWSDAPSETVLSLGWNGGPGCSSVWNLSAITLPSRRRVYVEQTDYNGTNVLAATPPTFTPNAEDLRVLLLLAKDNGKAVGTGVIGSIPDEISIGPKLPKEQLITIIADLLAHSDNDLRDRVDCSERASDRKVVEQWLRDRGALRSRVTARRSR